VSTRWRSGNRARLLENGEEYFPAVFKAIRAARHEVIVETFIVFEDKVGLELHAALIEAARRGAQVDVLVDGFGSCDLTPAFKASLAEAGVRLRSFDPAPRILGIRANVLRRMHRKLIVVDGAVAFAGGINFSADHLSDFGPEAKQDYAVELEGPIVEDIHRYVAAAIRPHRDHDAHMSVPLPPPVAGGAEAMLVVRDNDRHRDDIEREYRAAIRIARRQVIIANAYFFPGYRLLRQLRLAARRGVDVHLILQGQPDMPIVKTAAELLYEHLQRDGVQVHEYCKRPLHGKVAVVDGYWSTVGSSNLDPLSLALNLEANVILRDRAFAECLRTRLQYLIDHECRPARVAPPSRWSFWPQLRSTVVFHFLRRFSTWAGYLPRHAPKLKVSQPSPAQRGEADTRGRREVESMRGARGH
jgi:cardiolipin synthase A/B